MPRCGTCGKVNRDGAVFCQDCGVRMPTVADDIPKTRVVQQSDRPVPQAVAAAGSGPNLAPATLPCGSCGAQNPIGMNFCKMCGGKLGVSINPVQATPPAQVAKTACPSCGGLTPASYQFCQHCGVKMAEAMQRAGSNPSAAAIASTIAVPPTPPAGMRAVAAQASVQTFSKPEPVARVVSTPIPATASSPGTKPRGGIPTAQAVPISRARIVSLRPDGTDASSVIFEGEALDLGRSEGSLKFESDPYLAARHARLERRERSYFLYPLDFVNGVFVRIREPQTLIDGDSFLVGRQLLRFEVPLDEERDARPAIELGVAVFGSPLRPAWGRLRQLTVAALTLDVYYLTRPEIIIGREEGNIRFLDDEHMSRKHAALTDQRGRTMLEDLGSSNGTYLRVRQPRELRSGDLIRMGDQLLRFEL